MIELLSTGDATSYKIQTKTISISVNPKSTTKSDVVLFDHDSDYSAAADQKVFSSAGEFEVKTTTIEAVSENSSICFRIESQQVSLAHIPDGAYLLDDSALERLTPVDIVLIESTTTTAESVSKLISSLEPRIIVLKGASNELIAKAAADFGVEAEKLSRINFNAKDLPQDSQKLYILE